MQARLETRTRGDFVVLHFMQHLSSLDAALPTEFAKAFETIGKATQKEFFVDAEPTGPGYLTLQTYGLEPSTLRVLLNGQLLPLAELPELKVQKTWTTWTEVIPGGFLVKGANTIRFETTGPKESLLVRDVILHWHEPAF